MEAFPHVFQYPYHALQNQAFPLKGQWGEKFFKNNNPIIVELGCGKGEYTVGLARLFPKKNFIGVDIKGARIWSGAKQSYQEKLPNVAFIRTSVELTHYFFNSNEVSEIWLTFPDPQMKKTRKRLTATNFIDVYRRYLKQEGVIHLKTDSNFQFTYTKEMVKENNFELLECANNLYAADYPGQVLAIRTHYEQQWIDRGLSIKYMKFRPHNKPLLEPDVEIEPDAYRSYNRSRRGMQEIVDNE